MNELSSWRTQHLARPDDIQPEYSYLPPEEEVHLADYWRILVKRRQLVVLLFLAVFAISAFVNFSATPLYTATAMLQIEPQNPAITGLAEILSVSSGRDAAGPYDYYQTQYSLLKSRALAARVITSLGLASDQSFKTGGISANVTNRVTSWVLEPFRRLFNYGQQFFSWVLRSKDINQPRNKFSAPSVDPRLVTRYLRYLKIAPVKNTRLVEVVFSTPDPHLSQRLADAHAAGFIRMNLDNRAALTDEARAFLDKKNAELRAKFEQSEEALNRFRQTHGVVSLDKGENIVVDRLVALNSQLTTARAQRIEAESFHRTVANKKYQDLSQLMTQGSIPQLKANLATLEAEKARVSTIFKPDHPRIQELGVQISAARGNLNSEIANVVRGIESSYVAARAREEALEREAKKQEQLALNLKHIGVQYAVLQEDVNVNRALYESVLKRLSETNVSNDLAISNVQITQRADFPLQHSSPQTARNLLFGAIAGLLLGVGTAFLLDYLDTKMSTPEHVERAVSLNTLGVVPDLSGLDRLQMEWKRSDRSLLKALKALNPLLPVARNSAPNELLLTKHHPQSIFPESYRSIRTSLLFSRPERPPQVILLTSAAPGEGKTGTSLNLGIALAQDGHRVLIIDADLRKGCCHDRLGMTNHKGLSNILTGNLVLEEGIQPTPIRGLSLLSCGVSPPSPADLLGSKKMKEILTSLRESFDFIIIDSPPAVALADAAVLSVMVDGVVLVFHGRKTTTESARHLIERLDAVHAPVLGVVLNSVDLQNPEFAYYGHYRSYYPEIEQSASENKNGKSAIKSVQESHANGISTLLANSTEHHRQAAKPIVTQADSENIEEIIENQSKSAANSKSQAKNNPTLILDPIETRTSNAIEGPLAEVKPGAELLPQESLDRLIVAVAKSIGAIAPLVVREHIRALGESYSAFPKQRIGELLKLLQQEISQRTNAPQVQESTRDSKA